MTAWFVYLSYLAALNPARLREALPERDRRAHAGPLLAGAAAAAAAGVLIAAAAGGVLDALDITPETWRIAAGAVAALVGFRVLISPARPGEPELGDMGNALVPVFFPLLMTPELVALISIYGATESMGLTVSGLAVGLAVSIGVGFLRRVRAGLWLASARFAASFLILAGFALIVEGIRDV